ncbi:MAG: hypothetical protein U0Q18_08385 [Bryobacteraceae bacterium]
MPGLSPIRKLTALLCVAVVLFLALSSPNSAVTAAALPAVLWLFVELLAVVSVRAPQGNSGGRYRFLFVPAVSSRPPPVQ